MNSTIEEAPDHDAARGTPLQPPRWTRWAVAVGLVAIALRSLGAPVADLDMFHEMALIRESLADGQFARQDVYAYTPTHDRVIHHEWGTGAVLYAIVTAGWGGAGIVTLWFLLLSATAFVCYWCARRRGAPGIVLAPLVPIATALAIPGTAAVRAQLFTFLFLACLLALLEWDRRGGRLWLAVWLPLYVVWLNMHGGFVVGAGVFGLYSLERFGRSLHRTRSLRTALTRTSHLLLAGMSMVFLTLINPYGPEYLPYLWHALLLERPAMAEWAPLWDPRVHWEHLVAYAVSLLFVAYAAGRSSSRRLPGLLLVMVVALLAARSQRLLPVYAMVWIVYVPACLGNSALRYLLERVWGTYAVRASAGILLVSFMLFARAIQLRFWELRVPTVARSSELYYPAGAVDYLAAHSFSGNLMTHFNDGAFVSWNLYPAVMVGMDSRYEVAYPPELANENMRLFGGHTGWEEMLVKYPTDAVLVPRSRPLDTLLRVSEASQSDGWQRVYQDDAYAIFARPDVAARLPATDRTGEVIVGTFP